MRILLLSSALSMGFAGNQCSDSEYALWNGSSDFTHHIKECAIINMGAGEAVKNCLVNKYGGALRSDCAKCFGDTVQCGRDHCAAACAKDSGSPGCLKCTKDKGCVDLQNNCTGYPVGPPPPVALSAGNGALVSMGGFVSLAAAVWAFAG